MIKNAPNVLKAANDILEKRGIFQNPYFKNLENGEMSLEQFQKTQEQFYFAVVFFSRPMAALVGRIPSAKDRLDILHNVLEEHGDLDEDNFHATTFLQFLKSIKATSKNIEDLVLDPSVRAFNSVLTTSCTFDEVEVGICCMGIIELAFATISAKIGKAVVERKWIKEEELVHYKLHAEIDQRHAEEFFCVVEKLFKDPYKNYLILQGLNLGAYILDRLYQDLLKINNG